jgi:YegS/Rv2252/BmrU family lipid kinase
VSRSFVLLANPASAGGRALAALPAVIAELDSLGAPHRTVTTRSSEHAGEEAARAAANGEVVAALGGDGLLRPIVGALKGTEAALALIPCGRGNDFARVLGVPKDPTQAARLAVRGAERVVDVASVDRTPYVGIASLGFDSDANRIANQAKLVKGDAVYLYAALRALVAWKPARFTVTVDGERHELTGYSVAVGNSRYFGGGMMLLPHAEVDDGKLDVLMVARSPKLEYLLGLAKVFKGTHLDSPHITLARGEEIEVESDRPFVVYADGDPIGATPATMRVEARCLRVIVPAAAA